MIRRFTTFFLIICFILLIGSSIAFADDPTVIASGTCGDNATWSMDSSGVLTISGSGAMKDYYYTGNVAPWYEFQNQLSSVIIDEGISHIGNYAFFKCNSLVSAATPNSVVSIGKNAFSSCNSLSDVFLADGLDTIGESSFAACNGLTYISIPDSVTSIGNNAFSECGSLKTVKLSPNADLSLQAFSRCSSLEKITIPEGVKTISTQAFNECSNLSEIILPNSLTSIGPTAFYNCVNLTDMYYNGTSNEWGNVSIAQGNDYLTTGNIRKHFLIASGSCGENATWILYDNGLLIISGSGAMTDYNSNQQPPWNDYKTSIISVIVEEGITSIGTSAFGDANALTNVTLSNTVTRIGDNSFYKTAITSIAIPSSVTYIGSDAFWYCTDLTSVDLSEGLLTLNGFMGCSGITSIDIPSTVTQIESRAFQGCTSLSSVTIGAGVVQIEKFAFRECSIESLIIEKGNDARDIQVKAYSVPSSQITTFTEGLTYDAWTTDPHMGGVQVHTSGVMTADIFASSFNTDYDKLTIHVPSVRSGSCGDNAFWDLSSSGVLKIYGSGEMTDYNYIVSGAGSLDPSQYHHNNPWDSYRSSINTVYIEDGITKIGQDAFYYSENLTTVSIGKDVTYIGSGSFEYCTSLETISLPDGVETIDIAAFYGCTGLIRVDMPDTVTTISSNAFYGCTNLSDISMPASLTTLKDGAFEGCSALTQVSLPDGVQSIYSRTFFGCSSLTAIDLPETIKSIGAQAFRGCSSLRAIEIPEGVTTIYDSAFAGCRSLTNIFIPSGVTTIGDDLFKGCTSLTRVFLPSGITCIGWNAFQGCTRLTDVYFAGTQEQWNNIEIQCDDEDDGNEILQSVRVHYGIYYGICGDNANWFLDENGVLTISGSGAMDDFVYNFPSDNNIPWYSHRTSITSAVVENGITRIGDYAFYTTNLADVSLPETVTSIGTSAFVGCPLSTIDLPDSIVSIGDDAFDSSAISTIDLPDSIASIGSYAFFYCRQLSSVTLPSALTTIEEYTFADCSLTSIRIPETVSAIGTSAFDGCNNLTSVYLSKGVTSIGLEAFANCNNLTDVYFDGTEEEWNSISINTNGDGNFVGAEIHFVEPVPEAQYVIVYKDREMVFQATNETDPNRTVEARYEVAYTGSSPNWLASNGFVKKVTFSDPVAPTTTAMWFNGFSQLQTIEGLEKLDTSNVTDMSYMFNNCEALTSLNLSSFDTSRVENMNCMFGRCIALTSLDIRGFDTSSATSMMGMFRQCYALTSVDVSSFDTSKVVDMSQMFKECSALTTIFASDSFIAAQNSVNMFTSSVNLAGGSGTTYDADNVDGTYACIDTPETPGYFTRKVPAARYAVVYDDNEMIFQATDQPAEGKTIIATYPLDYEGTTPPWYDDQGNNITKVTFADPVAPTSTRQWFSCFTHLKTIDGIKKLDTSAVTDMSCMFESCHELETLDLSGFDTSNVTNMGCMFGGLDSLETLDLSGFDTSSVTDMSEMFTESSFTTLDLSGFDTSNVTNMENMFYCCSSLDTIYAGTGFVACSNSQNMFTNCPNLVGETGTPYNSNYVDGTYARIGTFENPGYFTDKTTNKARFVIVYNNGEMIFQATRKPLEGKTIKAVYALGKYIFTDTLMYPAWVVEEASNVTSITFADVVTPVKTWWWFKDFSNVRSIQGLDKLDTSNVTNMVEMFYNCSALESLDLSNFDTSNVESIDRLFYGCSALTELDLESFNTKKATSMYQMFANCSALTTIYASENFIVDVIRDIDDDMMFSGCTSLVGGNETIYDADYVDGTYARIDKPGEHGYFTHKTHADDLVLTEAKDATCETPGNSAYYTCSVCGKYFSDAEGTQEIEENKWVIPAAGHTLTAYDEVPAGCTTTGTAQYWTCDNCSKMFSDTSAENEIAAPIVVPALGHNLTAHAGVPAGCETVGNSPYWSCSRNGCGKYFSDAAGTQEIDENSWVLAATGHDWSDITYTWAEDNSTVTGLKACNNDHGHDISETVNTAYTVKTEPSCATAGTGKYTANFSNEMFAAQIKEVEIPTIAHTPCEPIKENIIDAACVTAGSYDSVVKCAVCGAEISREAIVVPALGHDLTAHEAVSASCETAGNSAYWTCGNCGKFFGDAAGTQEITENSWVIPAKGHSWGVITYTWANDNSTVTATKPCTIDHAHDITETVKPTFATVTPAQCRSSGEGIYVADFTNELFSTQTKKVVIPATGHTLSKTEAVPAGCETAGSSAYWTCSKCGKYFSDAGGMNEIEAGDWAVPAKGHAWAEPIYIWTEDSVEAVRACANDHAHDIRENADVTFATITQATCETAGRGICFATFKNSFFATQTKEVEIPATGHSYKLISWTWAEDFSKATALFTCEHDVSHSVEATATMGDGEIVTDDSIVAQKYKDVEKPYTATVTGPDGETYENTVTEILKATHKVHKHKSSDDGKSFDADVRIDSLTVEITGGAITEAMPVLVASYDKDGRFLGLAVVKKETEGPVEIAEDAESVKIFWVNAADDTPRCEDEEIERKAE